MPNLVVIFGPPASGKAAVGYELARLTGYRFFHNHLTADPAAALFGWGTERFGRMVDEIRQLLFKEAIADPGIAGVVFTLVWRLDLPDDTAAVERMVSVFKGSGGQVFFVELLAGLEARISREGTPFRVALKPAQRDAEAARVRQVEMEGKYQLNTNGKFILAEPHIVLDTEAMSPLEAAQRIALTWKLA